MQVEFMEHILDVAVCLVGARSCKAAMGAIQEIHEDMLPVFFQQSRHGTLLFTQIAKCGQLDSHVPGSQKMVHVFLQSTGKVEPALWTDSQEVELCRIVGNVLVSDSFQQVLYGDVVADVAQGLWGTDLVVVGDAGTEIGQPLLDVAVFLQVDCQANGGSVDGDQIGNQFRVKLFHVVYYGTAGGGDGGRCVLLLQILAVSPGNDVGASGGVVEFPHSQGLEPAKNLVGLFRVLEPQDGGYNEGEVDS